MKFKLFLLLLSASLFISLKNKGASKSGISFFKGNYSDAVKKATADEKYIFLYVYAKWCSNCKKLKKTSFKDAAVGNYYNSNFINLAIDGESVEGRNLLQNFQISQYPTLLILDQNGNQLTKTTGFMKPYILINFGRRIIP